MKLENKSDKRIGFTIGVLCKVFSEFSLNTYMENINLT